MSPAKASVALMEAIRRRSFDLHGCRHIYVEVTVYLQKLPGSMARLRKDEGNRRFGISAIFELSIRIRDGSESWKHHFKPIEIGRRL